MSQRNAERIMSATEKFLVFHYGSKMSAEGVKIKEHITAERKRLSDICAFAGLITYSLLMKKNSFRK